MRPRIALLIVGGVSVLWTAVYLGGVDQAGPARAAASVADGTDSPAAAISEHTARPQQPTVAASAAPQEQAQDPQRTAMAVAQDVPHEPLEAYLRAASPNADASRGMHAYLDSVAAEQALSFERTVDCRGSLCKALLRFKERSAAHKLAGSSVPQGVEVTFRYAAYDHEAEVTLYSTSAGTTFAQLLEQE